MIEHRTDSNRRRARKSFSRVEKGIVIAIVLLLLGAAVLFLWEPVKNRLRENETRAIVNKIVTGEQTIVVRSDALAVNGEGYEAFADPEEAFVTAASESILVPTLEPLPEDVVLTAIGTISIEKVDLYLPLLDGAGVVPLRYGAGRLEGTALPGEEGNCVILGHRMKDFGSLFNRLDEVSIGDVIKISNMENQEMTFLVDELYPMLDPGELGGYISIDSGSGKQITLITCTPTGIGSHRIVIIAHLQEGS